MKYSNLSAKILGQLLTMQALASKLKNEETIMSFICQGFLDIPGIFNVVYKLVSEHMDTKYDYSIEISHNNFKHYILYFNFSDEAIIKPYIPYIENFCVVIGVILEERKQRQINKKMSQNLEKTVISRTQSLYDEIDKRKLVEESLLESKQQLSFALTTSKSGIFDWNLLDDSVIYDDNYYYITGYKPGDFPQNAESWRNRVHPDDLDKTLAKLDQFINRKIDKYSAEFRFKCKDGSWKWILSQGKFYSYNDGTQNRFVGTHTDIDDLKMNEQYLFESREYLASVIDSMPSVIIGINKDMNVTQWNTEAKKRYNISREDVLNQSILQILHNDETFSLTVLDSLNSNSIKNITNIKFDNDHKEIYEEITIYPLKLNNNSGAVIRIDDVTTKVSLERRMIENEKMLSISGLAAGTAHEINNPLAAIIQVSNVISNRLYKKIDQTNNLRVAEEVGISLSLMKKYIELRGIPKMLDSIIDSGLRISNIVTDLLNFTTNNNEMTSTHSISEILDKSITLADRDFILQQQFNFKGVEITKHIESNLPVIICNEVKIEQVLLNIIRNGVQEMFINDIESPTLHFYINYDLNSKQIVIKIKDNGLGISDDIQKRIFDPFFTTREVGTGTGLGLSISYYIITENHGGELYTEKFNGSGTTFVIKLPVS